MAVAIILNLIVIIYGTVMLLTRVPHRKWGIFAFYTLDSNIIGIISSILYLCFLAVPSIGGFVLQFRYTGVCMMTLTFVVVMTILIPGGAGVKNMLLRNNCLAHHVVCPVLSFVSYFWFESRPDFKCIWLPALLTLAYGIIMMVINHFEKFEGPYPFFRVNQQSKKATVLWIAGLFAMILVISFLISLR